MNVNDNWFIINKEPERYTRKQTIQILRTTFKEYIVLKPKTVDYINYIESDDSMDSEKSNDDSSGSDKIQPELMQHLLAVNESIPSSPEPQIETNRNLSPFTDQDLFGPTPPSALFRDTTILLTPLSKTPPFLNLPRSNRKRDAGNTSPVSSKKIHKPTRLLANEPDEMSIDDEKSSPNSDNITIKKLNSLMGTLQSPSKLGANSNYEVVGTPERYLPQTITSRQHTANKSNSSIGKVKLPSKLPDDLFLGIVGDPEMYIKKSPTKISRRRNYKGSPTKSKSPKDDTVKPTSSFIDNTVHEAVGESEIALPRWGSDNVRQPKSNKPPLKGKKIIYEVVENPECYLAPNELYEINREPNRFHQSNRPTLQTPPSYMNPFYGRAPRPPLDYRTLRTNSQQPTATITTGQYEQESLLRRGEAREGRFPTDGQSSSPTSNLTAELEEMPISRGHTRNRIFRRSVPWPNDSQQSVPNKDAVVDAVVDAGSSLFQQTKDTLNSCVSDVQSIVTQVTAEQDANRQRENRQDIHNFSTYHPPTIPHGNVGADQHWNRQPENDQVLRDYVTYRPNLPRSDAHLYYPPAVPYTNTSTLPNIIPSYPPMIPHRNVGADQHWNRQYENFQVVRNYPTYSPIPPTISVLDPSLLYPPPNLTEVDDTQDDDEQEQ